MPSVHYSLILHGCHCSPVSCVHIALGLTNRALSLFSFTYTYIHVLELFFLFLNLVTRAWKIKNFTDIFPLAYTNVYFILTGI